MIEELKLLPCPFCGCAELRQSSRTSGHGESTKFIECQCGARMEDYYGHPIQKWNTRAPETSAVEEATLPYEVNVGGIKFGKGVKLQTLVNAAARWKQQAADAMFKVPEPAVFEHAQDYSPVIETSALDAKTITIHGTEVAYLDEQLKSAVELVRELSGTLRAFSTVMRASLKAMPEMWQVDNVTQYCNSADAFIAKADKLLGEVK
jgi:hypothetical protein